MAEEADQAAEDQEPDLRRTPLPLKQPSQYPPFGVREDQVPDPLQLDQLLRPWLKDGLGE